MSVRRATRRDPVTGATREFWIVDVDIEHPDGRRERVRKVPPVQSKRGAEQYERELRLALLDGTYERKEQKAAPSLAEFKDRFIDEWCRANKHKPSGIEGKESVLKNYLLPLFANRRLDSSAAVDEDRLKRRMAEHSTATYKNAASTLNVVLKVAARGDVIPAVPHQFQLLKRGKGRFRFYDFDEYERLVDAAAKLDARIELLVLLGGDAGLRRGEIIALEWGDVDVRRGLVTVERSEWQGHMTETKGMEFRTVPMTERLQRRLTAHRHLRGERVLYTDAGETITAKVVQRWMSKAQRVAGLRATGAIHLLRHTFCSHLAMRGAAALAIQRLAGHKHLSTTLGYMHLAGGETERAIRMLDEQRNGNLTATSQPAARKAAD